MLGRLAQMRLEFAEGQFDRVEVGRILQNEPAQAMVEVASRIGPEHQLCRQSR